MVNQVSPQHATKLALISPYARSLVNFRGPLIRDFVQHGVQVYALAPDFTPHIRYEIEQLGGISISYPLQRTGTNPLQDIYSLYSLVKILRKIKPRVVLTYQPKANIYGMLAAEIVRVPKKVAWITGLGSNFVEEKKIQLKKRVLRSVMTNLYKRALQHTDIVIFQNKEDQEEFLSLGIISSEKNMLLAATGIDLDKWLTVPPHLSPFTFTMVARLLKEKGVREFAEAARMVKARHPEVCFLLIGPLDTNPGALSEEEVRGWVEEGILEWVPWTDDVRSYLRQTSVYVLPSYREGVPRSTQEAMAMGRPVITTDVPGCRETVVHLKNGFLVPARDSSALAEAMECFINEPAWVERMGQESRRLAEERFDVKKINPRLIAHLLEKV
ncbi:MAG: glycosyltransferase family 1 protein [Chloroflexi bacterium]|nr:MAG: glycosyltransferase family 1 protein [Chloroflexota bacterium]